MTLEIGLVFGVLAAVIVFATAGVRADLAAVIVLGSLVLTGLLSAEEALSGFTSEAVIAIAGLLVLNAGLVRSGVMYWLAERLDALAQKSRRRTVLLTTILPAAVTGLISNTNIVNWFTPVVLRLGRKHEISRRRLLLPLAVAAMVGGNLTLIGAAHNLVVHSLLREYGQRGLALFELALLGLVLVAVLAVYTYLFGARMLAADGPEAEPEAANFGPGNGSGLLEAGSSPPETGSNLLDTYRLSDRLWEVWVNGEARPGQAPTYTIEIHKRYGLKSVAVLQEDGLRIVPNGKINLEPGDTLLVHGLEENVRRMVHDHPDLKVMGPPRQGERYPTSRAELIEVVVPPRSPVIGKSLADLDLRKGGGLVPVAIWRGQAPLAADSTVTPLKEGDGILLFGAIRSTRSFDPEPNFYWLNRPQRSEVSLELQHLGPYVFWILAMVVFAGAVGLAPVSIVLAGGAAALVLLGVISPRQVFDHLDLRTLFMIGGLYPLGIVLGHSGAAGVVTSVLVSTLGPWGAGAVMMAIFTAALLLSQALPGTVVAIFLTPVVVSAAARLGIDSHAFTAALVAGAASAYLLPGAHPAGKAIQQLGGYNRDDFLRFGIGLALLTGLVVALVAPVVWPF